MKQDGKDDANASDSSDDPAEKKSPDNREHKEEVDATADENKEDL